MDIKQTIVYYTMEFKEITQHQPSWETTRFYKRNGMDMTKHVQLHSISVDHVWSDEEKELHECRNQINRYDDSTTSGKNWEYYKKIINPYELVYTQKKYDLFPPSVCVLRPLSRSYFKMIEILDLSRFFDTDQQSIKTAHVCEGPGGFIEAIFDECSKHNKRIHISVAMTLRSKQINIPGWKRASLFLKKNRNVKILYGEDRTGDIMKPENQQYFIDYATHPTYGGKVDLFTADGGFDFSEDYMKQESMIFPLLLASTKIGLESIRRGGMFVLKIFDFYHKSTVDLLYFLSCHFEEWTLYKPGMSRPCNPEHYFIGKGFIGCSDGVLDIMRVWCSILESSAPLESLFTNEHSSEFMEQLTSMREKSFRSQTNYMRRVFDIIDHGEEGIISKYIDHNLQSSKEWCKHFHVPIYDSLTTTEE
jgi:23S rRNA U2552 (ribose-2'-O)-methylase RlmE/FtsJ